MKDKESRSPILYFKDNEFTNNMAYFEGNAIYIKSGQDNQGIEEAEFSAKRA